MCRFLTSAVRRQRRKRLCARTRRALHIPSYDEGSARYQWTLKAYRPGEAQGHTLASGHSDSPPAATHPPSSLKNIDYVPSTTFPIVALDEASGTLTIKGAIALHMNYSIHALKLEVEFWPDRNDHLGLARITTQQDKIED